MPRIVSPPREELGKLRTPLTPGERMVFEFFDRLLPEAWEIYVQPHLNGLRPDFVLLNPNVGIGVFEVKDWDLRAMEYSVERRTGAAPNLVGRKGGRTFSLAAEDPVTRVQEYKRELFELYCPRLRAPAGLAAITAGIIFPFAESQRVATLLAPLRERYGMDKQPIYSPVAGREFIESGALATVFPASRWAASQLMDETLARDLRNWLVEPDMAAAQREDLEIDKEQRPLVMTRTQSGYRRLRGPAGCGKSLVLAARASQLLSEGKRVLVVTYNITLVHYLMDLAVRWPHGERNSREGITWLNFHYWCKRVCLEAGHCEDYRSLWRGLEEDEGDALGGQYRENPQLNDIIHQRLPALVARVLDSADGAQVTRYDAILIDEGQDFLPAWWSVLRKVSRSGGEMLLVADATQDIYGTARSWTDEAMLGAGFAGDWARLQASYRLPARALEMVCDFAETYLPKDLVDLPRLPLQQELSYTRCKRRWVQTTEATAAEACAETILGMPPFADPDLIAVADLTFLCPSHAIGLGVVKRLGDRGVRAIHVFNTDKREQRRQKLAFFMGDARVKACTLHSFKGWEARVLVVYTGAHIQPDTLALLYSGLTRVKRHFKGSYLAVVSAIPELATFGKKWFEYEEYGPEDVLRPG